ncbi:glycosyltransferase family 4 protein [Flavobacterium sp. WC2429]|uniref:Glycosyltransferase family 4 protein n=1 Tax=Flavobacterium sp. WC2429 TaxID=3234140 RepID=A0AB39WPJ4_9FLAO
MGILFSHPTGNANVRAVAKGLVSKGILYRFYTSIAVFPGSFWYKIASIKGLSEFKRRSFDPALESSTHLYPIGELGRALAIKMKWKQLIAHETGRFSVDENYQAFDKHVAKSLAKAQKNGVTAVYAYEDGALETFREAKKLGLYCIYDLPIAYWETGRKLMQEEAIRLPQWASTLGGGIKDSEVKLARKTQEMELADVIVGPGSFVMNSIPAWAKDKKQIVSPFGSPIVTNDSKKQLIEKKDTNAPLRVLFVGSMGQRKGLGDLFTAMQLLNNPKIELVVLGSLLAPLDFYKKEFAHFIHEIGRPHNEVLALMRSCDVFCLPSIVEGRALVMQEAMSQGLPIIITPNTGGEDLVIEGETGFLVPIRSPEAIAQKINWFQENRDRIPAMGKKAQEHASQYTWDKYAETIVDELADFL